MRRRYSNSAQEDAGIDMTPMLDIVFIMLIFFIVTTSFIKEAGIDVNRPTANSAQVVKKGNIMIAVSDTSAVWIDKRRVEVGAVRANVERLKAENPEGAVVIQADKESKSGIVVEVMDQVRLAGVYSISVSAREP
ncbi:ExbD/TolR family protein [Endozoicomonas atrinae]|uniref:ExbD/TolR family protein n=1 Tax=Endozoicomonas atrinae TaxID=1333660 RepID=UPI003B00E864